MAIAFDAATFSTWSSGSSFSFNHTVAAGSNLILWVGVHTGNNNIISSVQYNSVSMTQSGTTVASGGGAPEYTSLWYLLNPSTGTNSVLVSMSTTPTDGADACASSYSGAKQSGVPDATASGASASSTSTSATITTVTNNCWVVYYYSNNNGSSATSSTGSKRGGNAQSGLFDTNGVVTPAGNFTATCACSSASSNALSVSSFAPSAVAANGNFLVFM